MYFLEIILHIIKNWHAMKHNIFFTHFQKSLENQKPCYSTELKTMRFSYLI